MPSRFLRWGFRRRRHRLRWACPAAVVLRVLAGWGRPEPGLAEAPDAAVPGVRITEETYEGRPHFVVRTGSSTWYYDRAGGGFSRLIDADGKDWISFRREPLSQFPESAAAGYRGLPNLVFGANEPDAGAGHPGFDRCVSTVMGTNAIETVSKSGDWGWTWRFTGEIARMEMDRAPARGRWWFLYEGVPGGHWSPNSTYWGTDAGGPDRRVPGLHDPLFGDWNWAYFGTDTSRRILFLGQVRRDDLPDTLWYLGAGEGGAVHAKDGMVVFGFGRGPGTTPQFEGAGQRFVVTLLERQVTDAAAHRELETRAKELLKP